MKKYVALLRAINEGGHTILKMTDLKKMFESFGLEHVQTYIQSGNVIFESGEDHAASLEKRIESQLERASAHKIQLFLRTRREVHNLRHDREESVFSNNFVEKSLGMPGTTRNMTVIKKIAEKYK